MKPGYRTPIEALSQPSYEEELRSTANWIRTRSEPVAGLPCFALMVAPGFALRMAGWLDAYADLIEGNS